MSQETGNPKLEDNLRREAGVSALRKIRNLVDDDSARQSSNRKYARIILLLLILSLCAAYYLVFSQDRQYQTLSGSWPAQPPRIS